MGDLPSARHKGFPPRTTDAIALKGAQIALRSGVPAKPPSACTPPFSAKAKVAARCCNPNRPRRTTCTSHRTSLTSSPRLAWIGTGKRSGARLAVSGRTRGDQSHQPGRRRRHRFWAGVSARNNEELRQAPKLAKVSLVLVMSCATAINDRCRRIKPRQSHRSYRVWRNNPSALSRKIARLAVLSRKSA